MGTADVNNDGGVDLVVGAGFADPGDRQAAGETYVLFGPLSAGTLELATDADIVVNGIDPGDFSGDRVDSGDINNDGADDLVVVADEAGPGGRTGAGESYVLFGPLSAGTLDLATDADIVVNGIDPFDFSGADVTTGDVNNDGADDIVIGALGGDPGGKTDAGETYVIFGPLSAGTLELAITRLTANDADDADTGTNNLQNFPDMVSATLGANGKLAIRYSVDSASGDSAYSLHVEFFKADADGEEGKTLLGSDSYPTSSAQSSRVAFLANATELGVSAGDSIVATATDAGNNTSEFSAGVQVIGVATNIPGLTWWGLFAMAGLLAGMVVWRLRRRTAVKAQA